MQIQEILEKRKIIDFLIKKGFQIEKDYNDADLKDGTYFKIDKRRLLVVYEALEEDKIKEIKDHFLIDRGLSYCIIKYNSKLIFLRSFGENKYFIYSERTKDNISKIDRLKKIDEEGFDYIFQAGSDISGQFYELFRVKRRLLASNINNDLLPTEKHLIAQKIFDRFFFIYFLCHKGIIKFNNGKKISGKNLFELLLRNGDFIQNIQNLFRIFNTENSDILTIANYEIKIPYLNGGLFRPDILEKDLKIMLKLEQWEEIFNFLNSYHWIIEDVKAAEEHEEKILTPEILGHVYERSVVEWEQEESEEQTQNLIIKITERKKKGVYYTPESITDYISKNTIIPYLLARLGYNYNSFEELIESNDKNVFRKAIQVLNNIKILDPACGSGAFLIKTADVIFGLKRRLYFLIGEKRNFYDLKLEIILENVYGVDILSGAIEISKLRLWLWLISDYEESNNQINALPNIEYNLKVGNSLVGLINENLVQSLLEVPFTDSLEQKFDLIIGITNEDKNKLENAKTLLNQYSIKGYIEAYYTIYTIYRRTHGPTAENLKDILENIRLSLYSTITPIFLDHVNKIINPKYNSKNLPITRKQIEDFHIFHWVIDFGHIILNGGFDIIIGNPPYIRIHKQITELKNYNKVMYSSAFKDYDIYVLFFERSIHLLKENGLLSFISPDKYLVREYGTNIRKILLNYKIIELFDISRANDIFDAATYPLITTIAKKKDNNNKIAIKFAKTIKNIDSNYDLIELSQEYCKEQNLIELVDPLDNIILNKIYNQSIHLDKIINKNQIFCGTPRAKDYHTWGKNISENKSENSLRVLVCAHLSPYFIDTKKKVRTLGHQIEEPYFEYDEQIMPKSK